MEVHVATAAQANWLDPVLNVDADDRVAAAVKDFRQTVLEIRTLSARMFPLPEASPQREALQEQLDDLVGGMQARADTVGISIDELFQLINADIAASRISQDHRPHGDYLRALVDENTGAYAAEATIHRQITRLQALVPAAVDRRLASDRACAGYVAGFAVRGGSPK
jgi:hypothetical protein